MASLQFLSLAPTTSASYPSTPLAKSPIALPTQAPVQGKEATPEEILLKTRRSSSTSSDASASGKMRFLKLGPVHFGKGDGLGDWSEVLAAE